MALYDSFKIYKHRVGVKQTIFATHLKLDAEQTHHFKFPFELEAETL